MAARPQSVLRAAVRVSRPTFCSSSRHVRLFSTTIRSPRPELSQNSTSTSTSTSQAHTAAENGASSSSGRNSTTHFGFQDGLSESEKTERVAGVFHSVAESYDRMNDLMSFGWHRVWKDHFVSSLNPGLSSSTPPKPQRILDVAGGTGDIAFRMLHHAHTLNRNPDVHVTISDINPSMLAVGKQRSLSLPASQQAALSFLEADATSLPPAAVPDNSLDLYTVAFGIRNFSNIPAALAQAHRVLKPGGVFACLEFSKVANPLLDALYKRWSFGAIPLIGHLVAGDRDSYQYLVESIERFPSQTQFRDMIQDAGFVVGGQGWEDLTGGVAAIHKGMKPL
ncbi:ubiquinone/menaquinone [Daldinia decipiens]|uniref:ubiquinone/menaquinone n=1 Tax=Daldinia decipiens TaxID=326647 RepID=UPI0020C42B7A|nr:ubiquinone/menaquinone [Daldinia decipiens]KAI1662099.1 ubiquinone/menaquinone [Daldinia decipiens]